MTGQNVARKAALSGVPLQVIDGGSPPRGSLATRSLVISSVSVTPQHSPKSQEKSVRMLVLLLLLLPAGTVKFTLTSPPRPPVRLSTMNMIELSPGIKNVDKPTQEVETPARVG